MLPLVTFADRDDLRDDEDETTATPSAPEPSVAPAPTAVAVVRLYVGDAAATAYSSAAGSADVTDGYITVPHADAQTWIAAHDGLKAESLKAEE